MASDETQPKKHGKTGENLLGILGTIGSVAGPLLFGPDFQGDLGAPFKMGALQMRESRERQTLKDLLMSSPHTAPIAQMAEEGLNTGRSLFGQDGANLLLGLNDANPGAAQQVLSNKLSQKTSDPYSQIKEMLGIQALQQKMGDYQSPEEKRAAALQDKKDLADYNNSLMGGRQGANLANKESYLDNKDTDALSGFDSVLASVSALPADLPKNAYQLNALSNIPYAGRDLVSRIDPDFAKAQKNLNDLLRSEALATGGKNLTGVEAALVNKSLPSFSDSPQAYQLIKQSVTSRAKLMKLSQALTLYNSGKTRVTKVVPAEQLRKYAIFKQALQNGGDPALQDPDVQSLAGELGLSGLFY